MEYENKNISATTGRILLKFETQANWIKPEWTKVSNEDNIKWKTTKVMKWRRPQMEDDLQWKMT